MSQIVSQPINEEWSEFDLSDDRVAASAEESTNAPGFVAVVDDERSFIGIAQQAATILDFSHGVDPSGLRVLTPPLTQSLIAFGLIGLPVFAIARALANAKVVA